MYKLYLEEDLVTIEKNGKGLSEDVIHINKPIHTYIEIRKQLDRAYIKIWKMDIEISHNDKKPNYRMSELQYEPKFEKFPTTIKQVKR